MKKEQKRKILFYGILAGALLLFAACAAHLAPYDPYEQNLEQICFQGFSPARGSAFFQHFLSLRQAL